MCSFTLAHVVAALQLNPRPSADVIRSLVFVKKYAQNHISLTRPVALDWPYLHYSLLAELVGNERVAISGLHKGMASR